MTEGKHRPVQHRKHQSIKEVLDVIGLQEQKQLDRIEYALSALPSVEVERVGIGEVIVRYEPHEINSSQIVQAIRDLGHEVRSTRLVEAG